MPAYYSEWDPYAAEWLRNLIKAGHIAPGDVDERSIVDVQPDDLKGYDQVHMFAGLGGWSLAARLAGLPDDFRIWTGSCPCQPFSAAGKRKGTADERHLWPEFLRLIAACRPELVFGEQVEGAVKLGWIDGVRADLAGEGYAFGFAVLGAHSVGAPHIRQRLWWVAGSQDIRHRGRPEGRRQARDWAEQPSSDAGRLADSHRGRQPELAQRDSGTEAGVEAQQRHDAVRCGVAGGLADTVSERRRGGTAGREDAGDSRRASQDGWGSNFIGCADGKSRRFEPSIQPLAHGVPGRVGRLRAYGNAIVPAVAAEFITAWMEA